MLPLDEAADRETNSGFCAHDVGKLFIWLPAFSPENRELGISIKLAWAMGIDDDGGCVSACAAIALSASCCDASSHALKRIRRLAALPGLLGHPVPPPTVKPKL
jgi:hypothetical protein